VRGLRRERLADAEQRAGQALVVALEAFSDEELEDVAVANDAGVAAHILERRRVDLEAEIDAQRVATRDGTQRIVHVGIDDFLLAAPGQAEQGDGQHDHQQDRDPATRGRDTEHESTSLRVMAGLAGGSQG